MNASRRSIPTLLRNRADRRSLLFVALFHALVAVQLATGVRWWLVLAAGGLSFIACIVNHNQQHCATFRSARLNRWFGVVLSFAIGQPASAIIPMHNRNHHVHNNQSEDLSRAANLRFRWSLANLLLYPFVTAARCAAAKEQHFREWREAEPELYRQLVLERWILYPSLAVALFFAPVPVLLALGVPYLIGQWGILAINFVQHDGCDPDSEYNHSRNFTGRWLNWWVLNNGFHTAHHRCPGLHWSRLPALHQHLAPHIDSRLEHPSITRTVVSHYLWPARRPAWKEEAWKETA